MKIRRRYNRTGSRKNARKNPYRGARSKQTVVVAGISPASSFLIGSRNGRHYGGFSAVRPAVALAVKTERGMDKKQNNHDEKFHRRFCPANHSANVSILFQDQK